MRKRLKNPRDPKDFLSPGRKKVPKTSRKLATPKGHGIPENISLISTRRQGLATRIMSQGATVMQVVAVLQEQEPGLTVSGAKETYYTVLKRYHEAYESEIPHHRALQLQRLRQRLVTMNQERISTSLAPGRKRANWSDIARVEMHISRITGALAPTKIEVDAPRGSMSESLLNILEGMSDEERTKLIAEGENEDIPAEGQEVA